jgi:hypothetical protein
MYASVKAVSRKARSKCDFVTVEEEREFYEVNIKM